MSSEVEHQRAGKGQKWFTTTHWSVVLAAGGGASTGSEAALEKLCRDYWYPLYAYVRRRGYSPHDAQDLTQEFFAQLLQKQYLARAERNKGKFRSFLLGALNHFLSHARDRAMAAKRGGGKLLLSLDQEDAEAIFALEMPRDASPEHAFEKRWAITLLERAFGALREEYAAAGKGRIFDALKLFLADNTGAGDYSALATELSMSANAVAVAVHRLRQRYRELVRLEVAHTVARAEAQAAAHLQHPSIVAIHEVGERDGLPYFSMDYVEGQSLAHVVRNKPLEPARAARYVRIIAEAIAYAHQQGILHRDLKPSNVLIDQFDQPRITDFGLAKHLLSESQLSTQLTLTGQVIGTPSFIPPEQAGASGAQVGPASDIYSLGALLYFLLTAQPPFLGATLEETLSRVLGAEPESPRRVNGAVPRDLETICLKCLQKEPVRRYTSAQELADDLGRFLRREPIRACPISPVEKAWRWCRQRPAVASLAMSLGVTLAALSIVLGLLYTRREPMHMPVLGGNGGSGMIDGKIYVVIPMVGDGGGLHLFYSYDPGRNSWSAPLPSITQVHADGAVGAMDNKLYVAGGTSQQGKVLDRLDIYDPVLNEWTNGTPMSTARASPAAAVLDGELYVLGGNASLEEASSLASIESYDPRTDNWKQGPPMPTARCGLGAAVMDGIVYAVGGRDRSGAVLATLEALRADGTWVSLEPAQLRVSEPFVAARDGILYVAGGCGGKDLTLDAVQAYSVRSRTWSIISHLPRPRMQGCGVQWSGGELYLFGGWSLSNRLPRSDIFVYNPARNTWRR